MFAEGSLSLLFLAALPFLMMATAGTDDRNGAVIFANTLIVYGGALIVLLIALVWSAVRSKHQIVAATAGSILLAAPFFEFSRELAYTVSERVFA